MTVLTTTVLKGRSVVGTIQTDGLRRLYEYWDSKRNSRDMPSRADIDPVDIPSVLSSLILFDVEQDPRRYRIRLVGTRVADIYGKDPTGQYLDEIEVGPINPHVVAALDNVTATAEPSSGRRSGTTRADRTINVERLLLPLSSDGRTVDRILAGIVELPRASRTSDSRSPGP